MMTTRKRSVLALSLLLSGAAGCVDLSVENPNAPEAERALRLPGDVESLIAGSYVQWWNAEANFESLNMVLSAQSFQHSAFPANFGVTIYTAPPRQPVVNNPAINEYAQHANYWSWNYRGLSAIRDGLLAIETDAVELGTGERRAMAFGKFMQGLHHASLALNFDQAFIVDEDVTQAQMNAGLAPVPYTEVMTKAIGYFNEAITLSTGQSFTIPAAWMSVDVSAAQLVRLSNSFKARFRANVARNQTERAAVNWASVISEANAGITADFNMFIDWVQWGNNAAYYQTLHTTWAQQPYWILVMADQSGRYQQWLAMPLSTRHPDLSAGNPFIIVTPDTRFPQGADLATQRANPGRFYQAVSVPAWSRPDRGTWRWSYYGDQRFRTWRVNDGDYPIMTTEEMVLLRAEGLFRTGDLAGAAALINQTRVAAGLNATDAAGTNTSCVPKLPNGTCGDLFEMLKWEKRLETQFQGAGHAPWYYDSRGWNDLYRGTQLHFPMPCRESQVLGMECYNFGGVGGPASSAGSGYWEPYGE